MKIVAEKNAKFRAPTVRASPPLPPPPRAPFCRFGLTKSGLALSGSLPGGGGASLGRGAGPALGGGRGEGVKGRRFQRGGFRRGVFGRGFAHPGLRPTSRRSWTLPASDGLPVHHLLLEAVFPHLLPHSSWVSHKLRGRTEATLSVGTVHNFFIIALGYTWS